MDLFLATRCFVGVGEASYSTLAPTILSDLFIGDARTKVLGLFYFAAPVGSGLGFIVGSEITRLTGSWQWSLRITPVFGVLCIILLSVLHSDPPRGEAEGGSHMRTTSWWLDIKSLLSNPAFMFISCGYTCVCFVLGSLSWFAIDLIQSALNAINDDPSAWMNYKPLFSSLNFFCASHGHL
ncbi:Protein spinster [Schistosoma japonicum]|nr:Protein spinster [Schistosoma japonicum]